MSHQRVMSFCEFNQRLQVSTSNTMLTVVVCLQTGVLSNTLETVVRATQLVEFIIAELNGMRGHRNITKNITDQLARLRRDDRSYDVGFYRLICDVHALIPRHQYCPGNFSMREYIGLCSDEIRTWEYAPSNVLCLTRALLRSMKRVLLTSMKRARGHLRHGRVRHHHRDS